MERKRLPLSVWSHRTRRSVEERLSAVPLAGNRQSDMDGDVSPPQQRTTPSEALEGRGDSSRGLNRVFEPQTPREERVLQVPGVMADQGLHAHVDHPSHAGDNNGALEQASQDPDIQLPDVEDVPAHLGGAEEDIAGPEHDPVWLEEHLTDESLYSVTDDSECSEGGHATTERHIVETVVNGPDNRNRCSYYPTEGRQSAFGPVPPIFLNWGPRPPHPLLQAGWSQNPQARAAFASIFSLFSFERISLTHIPYSPCRFTPTLQADISCLLGVVPQQMRAYVRPGGMGVTLDTSKPDGGIDFDRLDIVGSLWMRHTRSEVFLAQLANRLLLKFSSGYATVISVDEISRALCGRSMSDALSHVTPICVVEDETLNVCLHGQGIDLEDSVTVCRQDKGELSLTPLANDSQNQFPEPPDERRVIVHGARPGTLEFEVSIAFLLSQPIPVLVLPNDAWGEVVAAELNACAVPACYLHSLVRKCGVIMSFAHTNTRYSATPVKWRFSISDLLAEARFYHLENLARYIEHLELDQ